MNEHEPLRILAIAAHPDDLEFGIAGSVAKWVNEGAEVIYCLVTDGSAGSNDPDTNLQELIERRQHEQRCAAETVGVKQVIFLGYPDGDLQPTIELRRDLTRIIRQLKPYRVMCQDPTTVFVRRTYINHPDHRAAGEAATYAVFPSAESRPIFPELLEEGLEPHKVSELYLFLSTRPDHYEDITAVMEQKQASLSCHTSQVDERALKFIRVFNHETAKEAKAAQEVNTASTENNDGVSADCKYAEAYRIMKLNQNFDKLSDPADIPDESNQ